MSRDCVTLFDRERDSKLKTFLKSKKIVGYFIDFIVWACPNMVDDHNREN